MPKISIIIAVYNVEKYLKRCFDSLLNQTLKDIEIICIDDCSTDNSLKMLREYAGSDNRVCVIESEKNQGAAVARNRGLQLAKGEYLGFIDPDDAIDLNYYEELYKTAKEKDVDVVKCCLKTIMPDGSVVFSKLNERIQKNNNIYDFSYEWTTAIYRSEFVKEHSIVFPEDCPKGQDIAFLARIVYRNASFALIDNVYYSYYKREEGALDSPSIPIKYVKSALKSVGYILQEINNSDLSDNNVELYAKMYAGRLCVVFYTLFQNETFKAKVLCAEALIKFFHECKNTEKLTECIPYKWMIEYIKNKDSQSLATLLSRCTKDNLNVLPC